LEVSIDGAKGVLLNVAGGEDLGILEVYEAADIIAKGVDPDAQIIFGAVIDPTFPAGMVKVTLIATGFDTTRPNVQRSRSYPAVAAAATTNQAAHAPQPVAVPTAPPPAQPSRPVQPPPRVAPSFASGDDLDIPPFLRNRKRS
jgi:cell division protein FtsZ